MRLCLYAATYSALSCARSACSSSVSSRSLAAAESSLILAIFLSSIVNSPSGGADTHTYSAYCTSADVLKFLFHISAALFRVEKFFPLHADSPHFTTNGTGRASLFTQIAVNTRRKIFVSLNFKRIIGEKSAETNSRAVFVVKEKTAFADSAEAGKCGDLLVRISSVIVPAVLVNALRGADSGCIYTRAFRE